MIARMQKWEYLAVQVKWERSKKGKMLIEVDHAPALDGKTRLTD